MIETTAKDRRRIVAWSAVGLTMVWAWIATIVWLDLGLFDWLGVDYALFATGVKLFGEGRPAAIFDLPVLRAEVKPFLEYIYHVPDQIACGPIPHQAVAFAWYVPFAFFPPAVGYLSWAAVNLAVAAHVVHRLVARLPEPSWAMTALLMTFFPLAYTVFVGQPIIIMLFAFTQAYLAWERGRDFEAGLWCGVLSLKIQYPVFVTLVLMAKGRWRSVAGVATTTAAIFLGSWAVYGTRGMLAFLRTMRELSGFRTVHPFTCPRQMINWRGLLVNALPPWTTEAQGMALTIVLSLLTASTLIVIWRGPWNPTGTRFASQMLGTMLVTMLANFHNHIHGATLLLVPALAVMARSGMPPTLGGIMRAALYAPVLALGFTFRAEYVTFLMIGLMAAALATIVAAELAPESVAREILTERRQVVARFERRMPSITQSVRLAWRSVREVGPSRVDGR
jgi:hypothetical protein